ncbi:hypothetical protein [Streptomyces meridianus]|uniref:Integral membrane protein n=1 Tax=Streptomyces meridianus TaxID=2938945 RepID=A0ABT0XDE8_9ACTN|nr:hypothetical protein [Streptomyces meridianus]MCM2580558.1 hypothetical protein [Streptomyces meridianus]
MPDRRRRAALCLPLPAASSVRPGALLLRGRRPASGSPSSEGEDNPFAPPPEGRPDQPWQPRRPQSGGDRDSGADGSGDGGDGGDSDGDHDKRDSWGQWSSRQPGPHSGGFGQGDRDGDRSGPERPGGPGGLRWDPTDPVQRRARYALLSGMWAFFFALFNVREIALLLGALALYWGISSLRGKAKPAAEAAEGARGATGHARSAAAGTGGPGGRSGHRPQATAAISGLVTGSLALALVAAMFSMQLVYRDYYACVNDSLTQASRDSCKDLLPEQLRPLLEGEQKG